MTYTWGRRALSSKVLVPLPSLPSFFKNRQNYLVSAIHGCSGLKNNIHLVDLAILSSEFWVDLCSSAVLHQEVLAGYKNERLLTTTWELVLVAHIR